MSAVLSLDQAKAAKVGASLSDEALQAAIDEEEAWLARRIGPLLGERTQRFPLAYLRPLVSEVRLRRPTDEVVVRQADVELEEASFTLRQSGWRLALLPEGTRFTGALEVDYTPTDELEVRRALKELLGLTVTAQAAQGMQSERMGSYSYDRGIAAAKLTASTRKSIVASLLEPPEAGSMRVRSSVPHGLAGVLER
jgi:hypothetical protein